MQQVPKGVFQAISRQPGAFVISKRIDMIIADVVCGQSEACQDLLDLGRVLNDLPGTAFRKFLRVLVVVNKVDRMGEDRSSNVVEQTCQSLLFILGKVPQDQSCSQRMVEAAVCVDRVKERKGCVLTAAAHADIFQALHGRCVGSCLKKAGDFVMI